MQTEVRRHAEYVALQATIRERGTARILLVPATITVWAAVAVATSAVITVAISTLVPLLVLAAGFEAAVALYSSVERIGRYLQAYHERDGDAGWEHVTWEFERRFLGSTTDPLFTRLFMTAVSVNFLPITLGGTPIEIAVLAALHFVCINRIRLAKNAARAQRALDFERFHALRREPAAAASESSTVL